MGLSLCQRQLLMRRWVGLISERKVKIILLFLTVFEVFKELLNDFKSFHWILRLFLSEELFVTCYNELQNFKIFSKILQQKFNFRG